MAMARAPARPPRCGNIVSLGETATPLIPLCAPSGCEGGEVFVKDEGRLPTGSFKARGLVMAVSMAKAFGIKHLAMPSNGNAGAALAAYASRAGIRATVFCPEDTPEINLSRDRYSGSIRVPRQWPDRRLRKARRARPGDDGMVRRLHAQGALSHRGQEDDGAGAGGAAWLEAPRCRSSTRPAAAPA